MTRNTQLLSQFTNRYSLSKTLRFELRPIGKTLDNMREHLKWDKELQTFMLDQAIVDAYQVLKPVFDSLHEEFITKSLENDEAKNISFAEYFDNYKKILNETDKDEKRRLEKTLDEEEKKLRGLFAAIYKVQGENLKNQVGDDENGKPILKGDSYKVLAEAGILKYIKSIIDNFAKMNLKTHEEITYKVNPDKRLSDEEKNKLKENRFLVEKSDLEKALGTTAEKGVFEGFYTYLTGFNQNRENYYVTKEDKKTAVASRIVGENLPKFCDNALDFIKRKDEYEYSLQFLEDNDITTYNKDGNKLYQIEAELFEIAYFNNCLSQKGIEDYNKKIGNANFIINLLNQRQGEKNKKLLSFKNLYKQIGCGEKREYIPNIKNDGELKKVLDDVVNKGEKFFNAILQVENGFKNLLLQLDDFQGVYWSDKALNTISSKYFASWDNLKELLKDSKIFRMEKDEIKIPQTFKLSDLFAVLDNEGTPFKEIFKDNNDAKQEIIKGSDKNSIKLLKMIFVDIEANQKVFKQQQDWIASPGLRKDGFYKEDENTQKIKVFLDTILYSNQILKYFKTRKIESKSPNTEIYGLLDKIFDTENKGLSNPTYQYDLVRNYLTQKPTAEVNKLKLNFENSSLAVGWDENKIKNNYCIIVKDTSDNKYLAILTPQNKGFFNREIIDGKGRNKTISKNPLYNIDGDFYEKMEYKQIATPTGVGGFVRKCANTAQQYGWICPKDCLNNEGKIIIKNDEAASNLVKIIDCYKDFFIKYEKDGFKYKDYNFVFKDSDKYQTLNDFFGEVEKQGYKLGFPEDARINKTILDKAVEEGKLYLFEIRNKDNNLKQIGGEKKEGYKNLHTIYWNEVFRNKQDKPKLNGKAEIFYRPAVRQLQNELDKKSDKKLWKKDKCGMEVLDHKRFAREKFVFHCNLILNYHQPDGKYIKLNQDINKALIANDNNICFIGIDRGEKHLAYYSVVNQKGEILEQDSLNIKLNKPIKAEKWFEDKTKGENDENRWEKKIVDCYDYNDLLDARASNRDKARKSWTTIGTIKELKEGYISQVVRMIVNLAIYKDIEKKEFREVPAYIVLENLNIGFKRGRQKIEKQVYQKLELALAKKLNFLVDKSAEDSDIGSVYNALQLTPANFTDIEKARQFGIMLYVRANYTSQTDPITGWRKTIYFKSSRNEDLKKEMCDRFGEIGFDGRDYYFVCNKDEKTIKDWTLWSGKEGIGLERFRWNNQTQQIEQKHIIEALEKVFGKQTKVTKNLQDKITENNVKDLKFAIDLIQQIRNTGIDKGDNDFLLSPVRNKDGNHFDSRKSGAVVTNGDANGAYNIARKGIMSFERIKENPENPKLYIEDQEWDMYLFDKESWKKQRPAISS